MISGRINSWGTWLLTLIPYYYYDYHQNDMHVHSTEMNYITLLKVVQVYYRDHYNLLEFTHRVILKTHVHTDTQIHRERYTTIVN